MAQLLFRNFQLLEPEVGELRGGFELLVEGERSGRFDKPIKAPGADVSIAAGARDAGADRQPRACHPQRSQHPLPRRRAADADDGAGRAADARDAQPRLHDACAIPAAPTGASRRRSSRAISGPAPVHRRARDRADRRPLAIRAGAPTSAMRCHCCNAMRFGMRDRRRRGRGAQGRARADAPGRRPHQDHDVGRRRLALRPARQPAVLARARCAAAVEEAHAFGRYVCAHAYTAEAITRAAHARRAHHRARQSDRRCGGQADGREGHVPGRQPRHLLRDEGARGRIRHDAGTCWRRTTSSSTAGCARWRSASGPACRSPTAATCSAQLQVDQSREFMFRSRSAVADRDHPLGHHHRRADRAPGRQDRHAEAGRLRRPAGGRRRSVEESRPASGARANTSPSS